VGRRRELVPGSGTGLEEGEWGICMGPDEEASKVAAPAHAASSNTPTCLPERPRAAAALRRRIHIPRSAIA
jgi:hypothetical protein